MTLRKASLILLISVNIIALVNFGYPTKAFAQQFDNFTVYPNEGAIALNGPIENGSENSFLKALQQIQAPKIVVLNSPGGGVAAALKIAEEIKKRGLTTIVPENSFCASACSILFFAGNSRVAIGQLGVHQMSSSEPASLSGLQYLIAEVLSAFDEFKVDYRVLQKMLRTPPDQMYFFSLGEKFEWGIDRYTTIDQQKKTPTFVDFPAFKFYYGNVSYPDFSNRDQWARMYRTKIRDGIKAGVNFSGQYSLIEIGCGTYCRFAYVADVATGKVFNFPYGGEEQYQMSLVYAADSRLVRASWRVGEMEDHGNGNFVINCKIQDLLWDGSSFAVINETSYKTKDFECSPEY